MESLRTGRTEFVKLNDGWDVEPNAPAPTVHVDEVGLTLAFFLNPWKNLQFRERDRGEIFFSACWRHRLGPTNDEGWHRGQCRFRNLAPEWGVFYEVTGELLENAPTDWIVVTPRPSEPTRHFLLYFKDENFECDAEGWMIRLPPTPAETLADPG
jgi:hypothetical protein